MIHTPRPETISTATQTIMSSSSYIDPRELNDLAAFASRGGLGTGTALTDCVAEQPDQLMYITGDQLILLRDIGDVLLASCEGVVGWVKRGDVDFRDMAGGSTQQVPKTVLIAPSPEQESKELPEMRKEQSLPSGGFDGQHDGGRSKMVSDDDDLAMVGNRESMTSIGSSEFGGIGGFMMDGGSEGHGSGSEEDGDEVEELRDDTSPATASIVTPFRSASPDSPDVRRTLEDTTSPVSPSGTSDWDIYGDYARQSMYVRATPPQHVKSASADFMEDFEAVHAARIANVAEGKSPAKEGDAKGGISASPSITDGLSGMSLATKFRSRIMKERDSKEDVSEAGKDDNESMASRPGAEVAEASSKNSEDIDDSPTDNGSPNALAQPKSALRVINDVDSPPLSSSSPPTRPTSEITGPSSQHHGSEESQVLTTPHPPREMTFTAPSPPSLPMSRESTQTSQSSFTTPKLTLDEPAEITPIHLPARTASRTASRTPEPPLSSTLISVPPSLSPNLTSHQSPNTSNSASSPHSIAATRQAVEAVRKTPEGKRPRGMTLVGRMEADLSAAKGPVPITFSVGGAGMGLGLGMEGTPPLPSPSLGSEFGLGLPSTLGRKSPTPLSPVETSFDLSNDPTTIRNSPSRFPIPSRSLTSPGPIPTSPLVAGARSPFNPSPVIAKGEATAGPKQGFIAARPRSRSFSATVAKAVGRSKGGTPPTLSINTFNNTPPMPTHSVTAPLHSASTARKPSFFGKINSPSASSSPPVQSPTLHPNSSTPTLSLPAPSARSSSFSFSRSTPPLPSAPGLSSNNGKTPRKASKPLGSPVSHRDYEETIKAGGMDFEIIQPKKSPVVERDTEKGGRDGESMLSNGSYGSLRIIPETDEWGFLKDVSPTPEIFVGRNLAGDHRAAEQKWLSIISMPLPSAGPPKKVRKLVLEMGIPASLRGRVWAWFLGGEMSARVPGLWDELCGHEKPGRWDEQIAHDVSTSWSDHAIFYSPTSPGRADLTQLLKAYSNFAPSGYQVSMTLVAGTLLIHCVAEDAFWLLSGLIGGVLRGYYEEGAMGLKVDKGVFEGLVKGSEKELWSLYKDTEIGCMDFLERWWKSVFIRCLPWPTALRVLDGVISEGPRFPRVTALTILTLSRERLLALPKTREAVLGYLRNLPQDSLLLPENFMRSTEKVRFREEDWRKMRGGVAKELGVLG